MFRSLAPLPSRAFCPAHFLSISSTTLLPRSSSFCFSSGPSFLFTSSPASQSSPLAFNLPPFFRFHSQSPGSSRFRSRYSSSLPPPADATLIDPTPPPEPEDPHHILRVLFFAIFPFITFCLGTWQVYRWRRKLKMIKYRTDRVSSPEESYTHILSSQLPHLSLQDHIGFHRLTEEQWNGLEFRPILVDGVFDYTHQLLLKPRYHKTQVGSQVITPLTIEPTGERVLINRGWVRMDQEGSVPQVQGPVRIVARPRISPKGKPNRWVSDNRVEENKWYWMDVPEMAKSTNSEPYLLDTVRTFSLIDKSEVLSPIPPPRPSELPNNHFLYICTWYGLTVALIFFSWPLYKRKRVTVFRT